MAPWNGPRAKVQLKLSIQRLQLLQEKKTALTKKTRRDIADLLSKNKIETARVRVEVVIGDEIMVELLELLALYTELLLARFPLLDNPGGNTAEPDEGVKEAVCSIIFAAPRTEVRELQILRDLLVHKFSREFAISAIENHDGCVNERVAKKLSIFRPSPELIDGYLAEIARTYKVVWQPESEKVVGEVPSGEFETASVESTTQEDADVPSSTTTTTTAAPPSKNPPPPSYSSEKMTGATASDASAKPTEPAAAPAAATTTRLSELDSLAARFEALKKR